MSFRSRNLMVSMMAAHDDTKGCHDSRGCAHESDCGATDKASCPHSGCDGNSCPPDKKRAQAADFALLRQQLHEALHAHP